MNKRIKIRDRGIGDDHPVFIIAEAGVNHNGSLKRAKRMVDAAKTAGADAIKFQTFITENLVTQNAPKAVYQDKTVPGKSQFEMLKSLELSKTDFQALSAYCAKKRIFFLSTPFEAESAGFLNKLRVPAFKIPSGELTNFPLLRQIARFKRPIILSTGMATLDEVKEAVRIIYAAGNKQLILLHCTSNYPTAFIDVNLKAIQTLANKFRVTVGYSDHTPGIEVAVAAVALGAKIIEKHFTLDKKLPGPDHKASLDPKELAQMVSAIRHVELALGDGVKAPRAAEREVSAAIRKSVAAAGDIPKGTKLRSRMLTIKRPGTGIEPKYLPKLLNKRTKIFIGRDRTIKWEMIKR